MVVTKKVPANPQGSQLALGSSVSGSICSPAAFAFSTDLRRHCLYQNP